MTVLIAVAVDILAGDAPTHAASLGLVTAVAAGVRAGLARNQGSLLRFVCGCILSQPVVHYAVKLMPHPGVEHGDGSSWGTADVFVAALQIMVMLAVVVGLTFAEQVLLALAIAAARLCIIPIRSVSPLPEPARSPVAAVPAVLLVPEQYGFGSIARRGPPVYAAAF